MEYEEVKLDMLRQLNSTKINDTTIRLLFKPRKLHWNSQKCIPLAMVNHFFFRNDENQDLTINEMIFCGAVLIFFVVVLIWGPW